MARSNYLLPLLCQRTQHLIERVRDDCVHGLIPRQIRVDIRLPKQVKERPLTLHGRESIIGHNGNVGGDLV